MEQEFEDTDDFLRFGKVSWAPLANFVPLAPFFISCGLGSKDALHIGLPIPHVADRGTPVAPLPTPLRSTSKPLLFDLLVSFRLWASVYRLS